MRLSPLAAYRVRRFSPDGAGKEVGASLTEGSVPGWVGSLPGVAVRCFASLRNEERLCPHQVEGEG